MRRADRLFQIVQLLRGRRLTTARYLAERLEVSERTVYRDVRDLILSGVPIEGEAGVGYVLRHKLDLPPLMFDKEELEALRIGARMAQAWGDKALGRAAEQALAKIESVLPGTLKPNLAGSRLYAPTVRFYSLDMMAPLRQAIAEHRVVDLDYHKQDGEASSRRVWPLGLFFWGTVWTLTTWCELRADFRSFRLDRIDQIQLSDEYFSLLPEQTLEAWLKREGAPPPQF